MFTPNRVLGFVIDRTLEFLSFCVTWHLHDGRESCDVGLKVTYFGEFGYLNSSCIRIKYYCYVFEFFEEMNSRFCSKTQ